MLLVMKNDDYDDHNDDIDENIYDGKSRATEGTFREME